MNKKNTNFTPEKYTSKIARYRRAFLLVSPLLFGTSPFKQNTAEGSADISYDNLNDFRRNLKKSLEKSGIEDGSFEEKSGLGALVLQEKGKEEVMTCPDQNKYSINLKSKGEEYSIIDFLGRVKVENQRFNVYSTENSGLFWEKINPKPGNTPMDFNKSLLDGKLEMKFEGNQENLVNVYKSCNYYIIKTEKGDYIMKKNEETSTKNMPIILLPSAICNTIVYK